MKKWTKKNKYNLYHGYVVGSMVGLVLTHLWSPHTFLLNFLISFFLFAPIGSIYCYKRNKPVPRIYWETKDKKRIQIYNISWKGKRPKYRKQRHWLYASRYFLLGIGLFLAAIYIQKNPYYRVLFTPYAIYFWNWALEFLWIRKNLIQKNKKKFDC